MDTFTKDAVERARIDPQLKARATHVLNTLGLTVSDVLREVLLRVAQDGQLPLI
jgi:DNA-damage-inducible protein J